MQAQQGAVPVSMTVMDNRGQPLRVRVAHTPADFFAATRRGEVAFLVYRLDPGQDLRRPTLTLSRAHADRSHRAQRALSARTAV